MVKQTKMVKTKSRAKTPSPLDNGYLSRSQRPLASLFMLLPLMAIYELGVVLYATDHVRGVTQDIYARALLRSFFGSLGITSYFLPGLIVVVMLLCWHLVRRDDWDFEPNLYLVMFMESIALAIPLFVFMNMLGRRLIPQLALSGAAPGSWQAELVFSIGAGIYEELVFRVFAIALVHWLLVDVLLLPAAWGGVATVAVSALAFAFYHFSASNPFTVAKCALYVFGGVYLAAVYVLRGFGIAAGTHAVYDAIIVFARFV